nr:MAG TPA: hypothetical protein [Microviridae sp.]
MFRKNFPKYVDVPRETIYDVSMSQSYDKDGVLRPSQKVVDASLPTLPTTQEYTLEKLLAAGVPLSVVDCSNLVASSPTESQINDLVDKATASVSSDNNNE